MPIRHDELRIGHRPWSAIVGYGVRDEAVYLLGHAPVPASQSGLEVNDGDPKFGADHRAGCRRIDVAYDDDPVRAVLHADFFVGDHDPASLRCV